MKGLVVAVFSGFGFGDGGVQGGDTRIKPAKWYF
jgi:hypothetical protein